MAIAKIETEESRIRENHPGAKNQRDMEKRIRTMSGAYIQNFFILRTIELPVPPVTPNTAPVP